MYVNITIKVKMMLTSGTSKPHHNFTTCIFRSQVRKNHSNASNIHNDGCEKKLEYKNMKLISYKNLVEPNQKLNTVKHGYVA